jgi:hypothetical protein
MLNIRVPAYNAFGIQSVIQWRLLWYLNSGGYIFIDKLIVVQQLKILSVFMQRESSFTMLTKLLHTGSSSDSDEFSSHNYPMILGNILMRNTRHCFPEVYIIIIIVVVVVVVVVVVSADIGGPCPPQM